MEPFRKLTDNLTLKYAVKNLTFLLRRASISSSASICTTAHINSSKNRSSSKLASSATPTDSHILRSKSKLVGWHGRIHHHDAEPQSQNRLHCASSMSTVSYAKLGGVHHQKKCISSCSASKRFSHSKVSWHGHTNTNQELESYQERTEKSFSLPRFTVSTNNMKEQVDFGIIFDIDGVIGRGATPFNSAKRMIKLLTDKENNLVVPISFCTNSTGLTSDKAKVISDWLDVKIEPEQMIAAHGPLSVFNEFHNKRVLFVGQGKIHEMAVEMGFTNIVTMDEVKEAFPLLDIVDHGNRHFIAKHGITRSHSRDEFEPIEAIVLFGEPTRWETHLQLLVDLLLTGGHPSFAPEAGFRKEHIPILACNMDLVFMAEACMPRFGHGAFLVCLESLYKKITGRDLQYTALIGKPSEITFRYSEHCISKHASKLGIAKPIRTLYLIGDNPEVDVFGANLYNRYIDECVWNESAGLAHSSRQVPTGYEFRPQTATKCNSVLVGTGVYDPKIGKIEEQEFDVYHHGHRDFETNQKLRIPTLYCSDVYDAVLAILERELGVPDHINNNDEKKTSQISE